MISYRCMVFQDLVHWFLTVGSAGGSLRVLCTLSRLVLDGGSSLKTGVEALKGCTVDNSMGLTTSAFWRFFDKNGTSTPVGWKYK